MRIARVAHPEGVAFATIDGEAGSEQVREIAEHPFGAEKNFTGRSWALGETRVLAPILPTKIICIGKNYADHIEEMGGEAPPDPVIFLKPNTAVIGPDVAIKCPPSSSEVHFEGELAAVVGTPCKNVSARRAGEALLGYTVANDVTARDQQRHDGQWTRAKGHDTFCPLGPWIETELDASDLAISTTVDGATKQSSRTSLLLHDIGAIVEWISTVMTLLPGDTILTGTPAGVGPIAGGATVAVTVEGIGTLANPVEAG